MRHKIERVAFWFQDKQGTIAQLSNKFFPLSLLLTRLLNEQYFGKSIKFVNIQFASEDKYIQFPIVPVGYVHYYPKDGGHLKYHGLIDFLIFDTLDGQNQMRLIWEKSFEYLKLLKDLS